MSPAHLVDVARIERFLARQGWTWREMEQGRTPLSLTEIQLLIICSDPVLLAEKCFVERHAPGQQRWRFFDHQKRSLRYRGSTIHECGAEVGKTRDIIARATTRAITGKGDQLITAAQDGHLDSIYDEMTYLLNADAWLGEQIDQEASKVKPYRKLVWKGGNIIHFRPIGYDGAAIRGLHVMAAYMDEASKVKSRAAFGEFFGRILPGGTSHLYSTPDGDRSCRFFELCQQAVNADGLIDANPDEPIASIGDAPVKFRWPKSVMPAPYWSAARERQLIEQYGGRDSSDYQMLVEGNWGDPAASVFPWEVFSRCLGYVADFVDARLLWQHGLIHVESHELNPAYRALRRTGDEDREAEQPTRLVLDDELDAHNVDIVALVRRLIRPVHGVLVGSADFGSTNDPTEIGIRRLVGDRREWVLRLQLRRCSYDDQLAVLRAVDTVMRPALGWGCDAGGVGRVVVDLMEADDQFSGRVSGYVFNTRRPAVNLETGDEVIDPATGRARTIQMKELATQLLESGFQRQGHLVPWISDYMRDYPSHTAKRNSTGDRTFSGVNDHVIDEARVAELRILESYGGFALSGAAGMPPELADCVPAGSARESLAAMEAFA